MSHKTFIQVFVFLLILMAFLAIPIRANAGGSCGSTYMVQWDDTLDRIASICGVTVPALYAANPGLTGDLYAGQVLNIPINNCWNCAPVSSNGTYVVQVGDSFSEIAYRFGGSMSALWAANPYIGDPDILYPGQVLNIPASTWGTPMPGPYYPQQPFSPGYGQQPYYPGYGQQPYSPGYGYYPPPPWYGVTPTPTPVSVPLSVGNASAGSPTANIELSNKANGQVYVSLQGTARDGTNIIREYPVSGTFDKTIPAGFYYYVAWVGGQEFSGAINLPGGSNHALIFHSNEVDVQ